MADHRLIIAGTVVVFVLPIGLTVPAWADYNGLDLEHHTSVTIGANNFNVWRVYARFTNPGDRLVVGGFGSPTLGAITVQSRNGDDSDFGHAFYNFPNGNTAPSQSQIDATPSAQWDTFVTVGTAIADQAPGGDLTTLTPGFVALGGTNWSHSNQAWYVLPTIDDDNNPSTPTVPPVQSVAGWLGDGDASLRVLMMQLTVRAGDNIRGTLNLGWFHPSTFGEYQVNEQIQTFNSFVAPAPGALALFALTMFMPQRRRWSA